MTVTRSIAMALFAAALGVSGAQAQDSRSQPAEFPPTSYKGKQYVDSAGCVFIRAGIDGNVSWVPRMSRARKPVCGFQPTGGVRTAAATPAPAAEKVEKITIAAATPPAAKTRVREVPVARPAPQKVVRRVAPAPARVPAPVAVRQTAPAPVVPAPPVVLQAPTRVQASGTTACHGVSPLSQQYLRRGSGLAVRCGPQNEAIVGHRVAPGLPQRGAAPQPYRAASALPAAGIFTPHVGVSAAQPRGPLPREVGTQTRIVPKHVALNRINTTNVQVPQGYRRVWEDDRLNPHRAEQTLDGRADMLLVWTQTVPRRLINRATGQDVTAKVPLVYPYLDVETQTRKLGVVKIVRRDGQIVKRVLRYRNAAPLHRDAKPIKRAAVYSSRSAPVQQAAPAKAAPAAAYVQVGVFSGPVNAQRAAQQIAGLGLPARIGKQRRGGKTYHSVQAGPVKGGSAAAALARVQRAGFGDAYLRR